MPNMSLTLRKQHRSTSRATHHGAARAMAASALLCLLACGNPVDGPGAQGAKGAPAESRAGSPERGQVTAAQAQAVKPPFPVRGDCPGLMLSWFDGEGMHAATGRGEIPEAARKHVRIASLTADPSHRAPAGFVYLADLTQAGPDGSYPVVQVARERLDALVAERVQAARPATGDVVLYSASWCGACKATRRFLEQADVTFTEKDVEKDPGAAAEMQRKASAAGKQPRGVPVIDFDGEIILGFDQARLQSLIAGH